LIALSGGSSQVVEDDLEVSEVDAAVAVDYAGRISITFYDDRKWDQDDHRYLEWETQPRFDVFYAYAYPPPHGQNPDFTGNNRELCMDPPLCASNVPTVDWNVDNVTLMDYMGLDIFGDRVWTSFMGTYVNDPTPQKSLIWSSTIDW
jgi:hypothetical protein